MLVNDDLESNNNTKRPKLKTSAFYKEFLLLYHYHFLGFHEAPCLQPVKINAGRYFHATTVLAIPFHLIGPGSRNFIQDRPDFFLHNSRRISQSKVKPQLDTAPDKRFTSKYMCISHLGIIGGTARINKFIAYWQIDYV